MDPQETGWEGANWTHLAQKPDKGRGAVNTVMKHRVP
jgi:hypothetical protein